MVFLCSRMFAFESICILANFYIPLIIWFALFYVSFYRSVLSNYIACKFPRGSPLHTFFIVKIQTKLFRVSMVLGPRRAIHWHAACWFGCVSQFIYQSDPLGFSGRRPSQKINKKIHVTSFWDKDNPGAWTLKAIFWENTIF